MTRTVGPLGSYWAASTATPILGSSAPARALQGNSPTGWPVLSLDTGDGLGLTARAVFDQDLALTKGEARLSLVRPKTSLSGSIIWAVADPTENRPDPTQEIAFDAQRKFGPNWAGKLSGRYDFAADAGTVAGLGVEYMNECVRFGVSLSRRFTSSTSVTPTTDFALSLDLDRVRQRRIRWAGTHLQAVTDGMKETAGKDSRDQGKNG